jgi:hypothetical protein
MGIGISAIQYDLEFGETQYDVIKLNNLFYKNMYIDFDCFIICDFYFYIITSNTDGFTL